MSELQSPIERSMAGGEKIDDVLVEIEVFADYLLYNNPEQNGIDSIFFVTDDNDANAIGADQIAIIRTQAGYRFEVTDTRQDMLHSTIYYAIDTNATPVRLMATPLLPGVLDYRYLHGNEPTAYPIATHSELVARNLRTAALADAIALKRTIDMIDRKYIDTGQNRQAHETSLEKMREKIKVALSS